MITKLRQEITGINEGIRTSEIAKSLNYSVTAIIAACKELQETGLISQASGYYYNTQGKQVYYNIWIAD